MEGRPEITGWEALRRARTGAGTFDDAVTILAAEVAEHPRDGNRREWLATALLRGHRAGEAVMAAEEGITFEPGRPRLHLLRSEALSAVGRDEDARNAAERAVALDPECADGWLRLAATCRACDDDEAAASALDRADELGPQRAQSAYLRGLVHVRQQSWSAARHDLDRAVQLDPANTQARALLAQAFVAERRYRAALAEAELALAHDPDHVLARATAVSTAAATLSLRTSALGCVGRGTRRLVALLGVAGFVVLAGVSVRAALLTALVLLVPVVVFARVRYLRLPPRVRAVWNEQVDALVHGRSAVAGAARTPNRWTWRVGNVAVVAYVYAVAIAIGAAFDRAVFAAAGLTAVLAALAGVAAVARLRRTPRAERAAQRHARRAMAAHARGDFATQWFHAQRLVACASNLPQVQRIFVHALAHQDADAAMMPLDALLIDPPQDDKARASIACAANEVSWSLLQRGEVAEALVWAKRAVDLVPDGRRALFALCLAENHEYNAARRELDVAEEGDQSVPPRLRAAFLRWRALAEARLSNAVAATEALQEARELDPDAYDYRFVSNRVRDMLETP